MTFTLNIWVVLYTCGFVMGIFMASLFFSSRNKYSLHVQNLTILLLILSSLLLFELAEESDLVDSFPFLLGFSPIIDLLLWPFLLFYIQFIGGTRNSYTFLDISFFSPFFLACIGQIPFLRMSDSAKLVFFHDGIPLDIFLLVTFKFACTIGFIIYMLKILSTSITRYKQVFSTNKKVRLLQRTFQLMMSISMIVFVIYSLFYIEYFKILNLGDSDRIGSLIVSFFIYLLSALIFKNPQLFLRENYSKSIVNSLIGREAEYTEQLLGLFGSRKIYLNEKLSLTDVAKELSITDQQLSYLVNKQLGISFVDFINTYRVNDVMKKISDGEHEQKTLLGIALEAGFNSKASFNRNFKERTGLTPSDYASRFKEVSNLN